MRPSFSHSPTASALIGLGLGVQASALFALSARVGLGTPLDRRVFGAIFAALIVAAALLFRRSLRSVSAEARTGPVALASAGAAVACVLGLAVIAGVTSPLGFKEHAIRFGEDASLAGTPRLDALSALVMLVLPGLGIGAAAAALGHAKAAAVTAIAFTLGWFLHSPLVEIVGNSGPLAARGAAAVGAGLLWAWVRQGLRPRWIGALGAALAAGAIFLPVTPIVVYPPWQRFPVEPLAIFDSGDGQITVQPAGGRTLQVLVDQRPVSPMSKEIGLERACLTRSIELWRSTGRTTSPRTLVLGVLTPQRRALLLQAGITEFFVDSSLRRSTERIQKELGIEDPTPGFEQQNVDLVLSFPIGAYVTAGWKLQRARDVDAPLKTLWLPPDMDVQTSVPGARMALASDGIERFAFGLVVSDAPEVSAMTYRPGQAPKTGVGWMATRPDRRTHRTLRHVTQRLAAGLGDEPAEAAAYAFAQGLSAHAAAQRMSSPFESELESVELDAAALARWRDAALLSPVQPSSFERSVIEGAAAALRAQGEVAWTNEFIGPIAAKYPGSVRLEAAMAWAEIQSLDFRAAAARLRPLLAADLDGASTADRDVARLLSDALVALDDPEGRGIASRLLRDAPQDPELFGLARGVRGMNTLGPTLGGYESLSLTEARTSMAGAVLGTITGGEVLELDPGDGAPLFLTRLEILGTRFATKRMDSDQGEPAPDETDRIHHVYFLGGFATPERGSFNSTAPPAHMVRKDRRVLVFYGPKEKIAGAVDGHPLLRGQAGIFTAFQGGDRGTVIQGRGSSSAFQVNVLSSELPTLLTD